MKRMGMLLMVMLVGAALVFAGCGNDTAQQNQGQQQQQQKKENYERMLEAVMQDEKELRDKMDEEKAVQGIKVDLEKNW